MNEPDRTVRILIAPANGSLGIPADVLGTICEVIGLAYPNAKMGAGEMGRGFTVIIDGGDRRSSRKVSTRAARKAAQEHTMTDTADAEVGIVGMPEAGTVRATVPEDVAQDLAIIGHTILSQQNAANYVELGIHHPDYGPAVIVVARSEGQTPHELRMSAERRADKAEAELARLSAVQAKP